MNAEKVHK